MKLDHHTEEEEEEDTIECSCSVTTFLPHSVIYAERLKTTVSEHCEFYEILQEFILNMQSDCWNVRHINILHYISLNLFVWPVFT